ncbi:MAG: FAD binding domain-containing protein [Ilumatobacteraceae bacterium]
MPDSLVAIDRIAELRAGRRHVRCRPHRSRGVAPPDREPSGARRAVQALADAAALVGSPSTRHVGTIGGNVMNASPAMDTGAPLVVLGASVELRAVTGSRTMPIGELWIGPGRTAASPDELCVAVHLPAPASRCGSAYVRPSTAVRWRSPSSAPQRR